MKRRTFLKLCSAVAITLSGLLPDLAPPAISMQEPPGIKHGDWIADAWGNRWRVVSCDSTTLAVQTTKAGAPASYDLLIVQNA